MAQPDTVPILDLTEALSKNYLFLPYHVQNLEMGLRPVKLSNSALQAIRQAKFIKVLKDSLIFYSDFEIGSKNSFEIYSLIYYYSIDSLRKKMFSKSETEYYLLLIATEKGNTYLLTYDLQAGNIFFKYATLIKNSNMSSVLLGYKNLEIEHSFLSEIDEFSVTTTVEKIELSIQKDGSFQVTKRDKFDYKIVK